MCQTVSTKQALFFIFGVMHLKVMKWPFSKISLMTLRVVAEKSEG